jgi:hypothetical protein
MSDTAQTPESLARTEGLLRMPVGLASPLWGYFAGAAMSGAAWWWMTRFANPANLEAMFGAVEARAVEAASLPLATLEVADTVALETMDVVEAAVETLVEPLIEAAQAEVVEAARALDEQLDEAPPAPILAALEAVDEVVLEPVGGESAPISPVVEVLALAETQPLEADVAHDAAPEAPVEAALDVEAAPEAEAAPEIAPVIVAEPAPQVAVAAVAKPRRKAPAPKSE